MYFLVIKLSGMISDPKYSAVKKPEMFLPGDDTHVAGNNQYNHLKHRERCGKC